MCLNEKYIIKVIVYSQFKMVLFNIYSFKIDCI